MIPRRVTTQFGLEGKPCNHCEEWRALTDYYKKARGLGGRNSTCKFCRCSYEKNRRKDEHVRTNNAEYMKKYRKKNPNIFKSYSLNYKARKKGLPNTFTKGETMELLDKFNGCFITGNETFQLDHVIPLKLGVTGTVKENMLPLKMELNYSKRDSNIFEWFDEFKNVYNLSEKSFIEGLSYIAKLNGMTYDEYKAYVFNLYNSEMKVLD